MTTVQITLPDELAEEATRAGLLAADRLEALLREELRSARLSHLRTARAKCAADPLPTMTADEIQAEIRAYRAEQRCATYS
ncbi:hypothetical protein [Wenzhouxiangella limi]|uniref:Antitoxin n=1 Tax=Wenzhouxiangella limi TaxID=2707351 RepID=A0A845V1Y4_9GAMM|nr:hypothetical protein [Wenzhouxiangella limi]NDY97118.1 hypothetical protein [Wenzhouxiangella limi]